MPGSPGEIGYLERGLWREVFKLEHVSSGNALALPSRFLIACSLVFDRVGYPRSLGEVSREFTSGRMVGVKAVNRVPYEIPDKSVLAFCPLEMDSFAKVMQTFQEADLLFEYEEGSAYNPGIQLGDSAPLVVLEDGRFAPKQYFWEKAETSYEEYFQLVEQQLDDDADFIDDCSGRCHESRREQHGKRLDFVDACLSAAERDGHVPVVRACGTLLPLLIGLFPQHATYINLLRLLVKEIEAVRLTIEDLVDARNDSRVKAIRDALSNSMLGAREGVDSYELCDALVNVLSEYRDRSAGQAKKSRGEIILPPHSWPNDQVDKLPDRTQWAKGDETTGRNLLVLWADTDTGRACIGYTLRFFRPY